MNGSSTPQSRPATDASGAVVPDGVDSCGRLPVLLIPAYKPSPVLLNLVRDVTSTGGIHAVVIVNDGSGPEEQELFEDLANIENVHVLHHAINFGKGAALKSGFNYVLCAFPESGGVVTADADGQHSTKDILRLARFLSDNPEALTIGSRTLSREIPLRSYIGNTITNFIFGCLTGKSLQDTQSGLRAIPTQVLPDLLKLDGIRYEFEMNMLFYAAVSGITIRELSIETIYLDGNSSSHFSPIADSAKIYYKVIQFYASSALAAILDLIVFAVAMRFTGHLLFSFLVGRVLIAGLVNFNLNRRFIFNKRGSAYCSLAKYYTSFVFLGTLSYLLIRGLIAAGASPLVSKTLVESALSILSFAVQGIYVFAERRISKA